MNGMQNLEMHWKYKWGKRNIQGHQMDGACSFHGTSAHLLIQQTAAESCIAQD